MAGVDNSGRYNSVAGNASINYPFDTYCANGSDVKPVIRGGSGGTFSATPNGLVIDSTTGVLDVSASTPDTEYTISYTVPGFNVATDVVTILPASDSSFSYPNNVNIRSGYLIPTITGATGGTFSGSKGLYVDPNTGIIDLARTSVDFTSFTVTYITGVNCPSFTSVDLVIMNPFIIRVTIPASGSTSPYVLKPQTSSGSCTVNWGDSNTETITGDTTHSFPISSSDVTYDISIYDASGSKFEGFNAAWDTGTITNYENSIIQWGDVQWKNNSWFLTGLPNGALPKLRLSAPNGASHKPDLSQVTSLYQLFYNKSKSRNLIWEDVNNNLANWDTSTITNMAQAFVLHGSPGSRPSDSQPNIMQLSNWDTSSVTDMNNMFLGAAVTANGVYTSNIGVDATNWNTQNVQSFSSTFRCKGTLTGIENLRTESCTNMSSMFYYRALPGNVDTKYVNGILRWDVSKVASFSSFAYKSAGTSGSLFPSKWKLSGDGQDIDMSNAFWGFDFDLNDSPDLCATKTVNETWYGGTSYTAWDMSNTTSISSMFRGAGTNAAQTPPPNGYNPNISTWQMSSKFTTMQYFARADGSQVKGLLGIDQDLGHWNVTNISSPNGLLQIIGFRVAGERPSFSTANYDSILSITDGWGSQAANVNSGVNMDFGTSQYTPGNVYEGSQGINTYTTNKIYNGGADLRIFTSIGDVVERPVDPNGTFDTYAIITGYDAGGIRATTQGNIGPTDYKVMDSDAVKGRVALILAGWTIVDGGAYIPFNSVEMTINVSGGDTFSIKPQSSPNNFKVDWGDGNGFVGDPNNGGANYTGSGFTATSPAYSSGGNKTVKICEDSSQYIHSLSQNYNGGAQGDKQKIVNINHWGSNTWKTFYRTFFGCNNLVLNTTTTPNLANGPSMAGMFQTSQGGFTNSNIGNWNMSSITNVSGMFQQTTSFNVDISGWDVGNVSNFAALVKNNSVFNQDISNWDTSSATNMAEMLKGCSSLNVDLNTKDTGSRLAWDVSNVTSFFGCLNGTTSMTYDIDKWQITTDASKSVTFSQMFMGNINWMTLEPKTVTVGSGAYQKTYLAWDTQRVTSLSETFHANSAFNKDIGKWDTSSVTNMYRTFRYTTAFNNGGQPMNTRSVTVGTGATARTYNAWDVSSVTAFENGPFENNQAFNQDVSNWDVSNAANGLVRGFENAQVFDHYLPWDLNTSANPPSTYYLYNMFNNSGMSTNNYTDTIVYWANFVKNQTPNAPLSVNMNVQAQMTFDSSRSGGTNFANAWEARSYLTNTVANGGAGWSISSDTILPLLVPSTSSLSFNGSTEYINVGEDINSTFQGAFSFSCYIWFNNINASFQSFLTSGFPVQAYIVSGAVQMYLSSTNSSSTETLPTSSTLAAGEWHHVAFTRSGNGAGSENKIYLNGGVADVTDTSSTIIPLSTSPINIGASTTTPGSTSLYFNGKIDEVMIWNTVLTQANIQTLANAVGSGNVPNPEQLSSGLQLWNRMGD